MRRRSAGGDELADIPSAAGMPVSTASASAQRRTLVAITPTESNVGANGHTPSRLMRRAVGFHPTRPQSAAGMRTEPPVSVPRPISAMPSLTATAAPAEDPPGILRSLLRSYGFAGVPKCGFRPMPEKANSVMLVLPMI